MTGQIILPRRDGLYTNATWSFNPDLQNSHSHLFVIQYAISQLRFVHSGLHLVTYLDVGNFSDKSTERTLHEIISVQVFLKFSDSSKPSKSVLLIYELAWLSGICKSEENLLEN